MRPATPPELEARKIDGNGVASAWVAVTPEWPTLLGRMLEDLTRVLQLEIQLAENRISASLAAITDRILAGLVALFAAASAAVCLVAALILLLHQWLAWWESLAAGGGAILAVGVIAYAALARRSAAPLSSP